MIVGIAGYMGSGKSFAGNYFHNLGAEFIETDKIVDDLYKGGEDGYRKIVNYYGSEYLDVDGNIDRRKLAANVFQSRTHINAINNLVHPLINDRVARELKKLKGKLIFVEGVKFDDKGLGSLVDKICWIDVGNKILMERLKLKKVFGRKLDKKVIELQSRPEKIDFLIENNGSEIEFQRRLKSLYQELSLSAE